jgi:hypothetical protein
MKAIFASLILSLLSLNLLAGENPTKAVSGKVFDKNTHEALAGVKVYVENSTQAVYTDLNGQFTILVNNQAPVVLTFSSMGYADEKTNVNTSLSGVSIQLSEL